MQRLMARQTRWRPGTSYCWGECTMPVAALLLQHDWLLTTACLGDSRAILDTGRQVTVLTEDHRVATHQQERKRLEKKGSVIAPVNINGTVALTPHW